MGTATGTQTPRSGWIWSDASGTALVRPDNTTISPTPARNSLVTVVCGNSIAGGLKYSGGTWYASGAEHVHASIFGGGCIRAVRMLAATTRSDIFGCYGYGGQTLPTILADLQAQWFDQIAQAGVVPELVIGTGLLENDIVADATVASMKLSIDTWLRWVQMRWPNCIVLMTTPHPSANNSTAGRVTAYQAMRDYILSLDNGTNVFVTRIDGYEKAGSPGVPNNFAITASRSGTTLTVTAAADTIKHGQIIATAPGVNECIITAFISGTGGTGTYTVSVSGTIASTSWDVYTHTDSTVHPKMRGAMLNGRAMAATMQRISTEWRHPGTVLSTNPVVTGSTAATGTGVSGTMPTGCGFGGSANGSQVSVADNPGWSVTMANNAQGFGTDNGSFYTPAYTITQGPVQISTYQKVKIVANGDRIRSLQPLPRITDNGGFSFHTWWTFASADADVDYRDGDVLTFISSPEVANSGAISGSATNYLKMILTYAAGTNGATVQLQESGVIVLNMDGQPQLHAPAAAGTATPDVSMGQAVQIVLPAGNITIAAPLYPKGGKRLDFTILQDSGGSRTITWNAAFKKAADGAGGANTTGATSFVYNGANWVQVGGALAFA